MWLWLLALLAFFWIDSASASRGCDAELVLQSQENLGIFFALSAFESSEDDGSGGDRVCRRSSGRPNSARLVVPGDTIFRHYISGDEQDPARVRRRILDTRRLRAGKTSYVIGDRTYFRMTYPEVVGVFVTTPDRTSEAVGVHKDLPFVDFRFPAGTGLVELEPGILLVPGLPGTEIPIVPVGPH